MNNIRNARFYAGDATEMMEAMASEGETADVIIMDPPRSGSTARFLAAAAGMHPRSIVYVSCNPETLARDLAIALKLGYRTTNAYPFDMFPFTEHVETVCLMSKIGGKST